MSIKLLRYTCPICGDILTPQSETSFKCRSCGSFWESEKLNNDYETVFERFDIALREQRQADIAKLASRRFDEIKKEYVSNEALRDICNQILNLSPNDFFSRFFLATCGEDYMVADFLASPEMAEHLGAADFMLDYLIRGLRARWIDAVSTLIETAYKNSDIRKYNLYRTKFEDMAKKVEDGIFDPRMPRNVFVAYSSKDMREVNELARVLEENGLTCFVAARNLPHGSGAKENYLAGIHTAIESCQAVVFVSSENSRSLRCEAIDELDYIKKNRPDMWRIELLVNNYRGIPAERFFTEFFAGLEYCTSPQQAAERYIEKKYALGEPQQDDGEAERKAEAARKAEEARKAEAARIAEAKRKEEEAKMLADFEIKDGVLVKYKGKAENVVIPSGVTAIGESAFSGCTSLTNVVIPASVTVVGEWAFWGCDSLISIEIPDGVTAIGDSMFNGCSSLTSVTIPNSVTSIAKEAFANCRGLTSITIPNSITSIGEFAFYGCSSLTSITIPNSVTSIGAWAFSSCISLTSITIPNSVISVGTFAFGYCEGLKTIYCETAQKPAAWDFGLDYCNAKVFWGCTNAEEAEAQAQLLADCEIEDGVLIKYKGNAASVAIPAVVTAIGETAFLNCTALTSVTLHGGVTAIGRKAFRGCENLKSINIPESVTSIGTLAFYGCDGLKTISIPRSVATVEYGAFSWCHNLKKIYCEAVQKPAGWAADWHENSSSAVIWCCKDAEAEKALVGFEVKNGVLVKYTGSGENAVIPNGVLSIGNNAFNGCKNLKSVTIPSSVTAIGTGAFEGCVGLTGITIPGGVTVIGPQAFYGCARLASITIPESVTSVGTEVFAHCTGLKTIYCAAEKKPKSWDAHWLGKLFGGKCNAKVVWGNKG